MMFTTIVFYYYLFFVNLRLVISANNNLNQLHHTTNSNNNARNNGQHISKQKRVMVISNLPLADTRGGDSHIYVTLEALVKLGYKVTMFYGTHQNKTMWNLAELGVEVDYGTPAYLQMKMLTYHYFSVIEFYWANVGYARLLRALNIAILDASPNTAIITLAPDVFHQRLEQEYQRHNAICSICNTYKEIEIYFWNKSEIVVGVNEKIVHVAKQLCPKILGFHLPYAHEELHITTTKSWKERQGIIYYGGWVSSNIASVDWMVENLAPFIFKKYNEYLHIYGEVPIKSCNATFGCISHGVVSLDILHTAILGSKWMIAPIMDEAGVSTKVIKALAVGTPVITTPYGLGGMESINDPLPIVVVQNMSIFASTVMTHYLDETLWTSKQILTQSFVDKYFSMRNLYERTKQFMQLTESYSSSPKRSSSSNIVSSTLKYRILWDVPSISDTSPLAEIHKLFPYLRKHFQIILDNKCPSSETMIHAYIRLTSTTNVSFSRPTCCPVGQCRFISYLNWDYGFLPKRWVKEIRNHVDFVWTLSIYHSSMFEASGVPAKIVRTLPFGIGVSGIKTTTTKFEIRSKFPSENIIYGLIDDGFTHLSYPLLWEAIEWIGKDSSKINILIYASNKNSLIKKWTHGFKVEYVDKDVVSYKDFFSNIDGLLHLVGSVWNLAPIDAFLAGIPLVATYGYLEDYLFLEKYSGSVSPKNVYNNCSICTLDSVCFESNMNTNNCEILVKSPITIVSKETWELHAFFKNMFQKSIFQIKTRQPVSPLDKDLQLFISNNFQWSNVSQLFISELSRKFTYRNKWRNDFRVPSVLQYYYAKNASIEKGVYGYDWKWYSG